MRRGAVMTAAFLVACLALPVSGALAQGGAPASPATPTPAPARKPVSPAKAAPAKAATQPSPSDLAYGAFQRGLYLTAKTLAEPLANLGDPTAQTLLGEIYSRGLGVPRSEKEAARWYEAAAKAGSAEGQFRYSLLLLDGKSVPQDLAKARDLMRAAAEAGIPLAEYNYAQMLIQASPSGGFTDAKVFFERSAEAGISDSQYAMSQIYAYGRGVSAPDLTVARRWLIAAAINGHDTAQVELGIWLLNGKGGPANASQGARWMRRAAARGNPIAMNRIAHLYIDGVGVAANKSEAAKWSVLARRADNADAALDEFFRRLDEPAQRSALEAANGFRPS